MVQNCAFFTELLNREFIMRQHLLSYDAIFWDFDGVIKDSVEAKTTAYVSLFDNMDVELLARVKLHHRKNGGVSRYEKIPLYLAWAGYQVTQNLVDLYCEKFSKKVVQQVINSPWVNGVREFILDSHECKNFFLITATPYEEIKTILSILGLEHCFVEIHGAPIKKYQVVDEVMSRWSLDCESTAFVGDSSSDYEAAVKNNLNFVLRSTTLNQNLQKLHKGLSFESLI